MTLFKYYLTALKTKIFVSHEVLSSEIKYDGLTSGTPVNEYTGENPFELYLYLQLINNKIEKLSGDTSYVNLLLIMQLSNQILAKLYLLLT